MWIPKTEAEIDNAVANKSLHETVVFDAKREIPAKNLETAKDVSAMANTSGGVLIYGIDEDENGFPNVLSPILLEGQAERIEQIIRSSIEEVPVFKVFTIETKADSSKGYLILVVPPSERAPHMVVVKNEQRFYGRGEILNYILSQTEVARLYERRQLASDTILPILEEYIQNSPLKENEAFAHLYLVARPVFRDINTLSKAMKKMSEELSFITTIPEMLRREVSNVSNRKIFQEDYSPNFNEPYEWTIKVDGYFGKMMYGNEGDKLQDARTLYIQVNFDGGANLFCGRAGDMQRKPHSNEEAKTFYPSIVAGNTTKFLALLGNIYNQSSYFGMVDVAVGLSGLKNSIAYRANWNFANEIPHYEESDYRQSKRVSAMLLKENPKEVAASLLMPLITAISQGRLNPFVVNRNT